MSLPFELVYISTFNDKEVDRLIRESNMTRLVAVDTEFSETGIRFIQIALEIDRIVRVYVFDMKILGRLEPYQRVKRLFTTPDVTKVWCGYATDYTALAKICIHPKTRVDIQDLARAAGFAEVSLDALSQALLGDHKKKGSGNDSDLKIATEYAAYDAYLTLKCFLTLMPYRYTLHHTKVESLPTTISEEEVIKFWGEYREARGDFEARVYTKERPTVKIYHLESWLYASYKPWTHKYPRPVVEAMCNLALDFLVEKSVILISDNVITIIDNDYAILSIKQRITDEISQLSDVTESSTLEIKSKETYTEPSTLVLNPHAKIFVPRDEYTLHEDIILPIDPKTCRKCPDLGVKSWCKLVLMRIEAFHKQPMSKGGCIRLIANQCWYSLTRDARLHLAKQVVKLSIGYNLMTKTEDRLYIDQERWSDQGETRI